MLAKSQEELFRNLWEEIPTKSVLLLSPPEDEITQQLEKIIQDRILPKSSLRKYLGYGRELRFPLSSLSEKEEILVLENFQKFSLLLRKQIESSIPPAFPKIKLEREENGIWLVIGDPCEKIAAEWKFR